MRTESDFAATAYPDFLRHEGIPTILRRDRGRAQRSQKVLDINRQYLIGDEFSEPYHQQQNPVEKNAIQWLKIHSKVLLDRTNAPPSLWLAAMEYLAEIHNHTAKETLRWAIPMTLRHGDTRDISHLLMFSFFEPVYYFDYDSFPESSERLGYWIGHSKNIGDALTWKIWDPENPNAEIYRSTVRSALEGNPNFQAGVPMHMLPKAPQTLQIDQSTDPAPIFPLKFDSQPMQVHTMPIPQVPEVQHFPPQSHDKGEDLKLKQYLPKGISPFST